MPVIYTIGHSNHGVDYFLGLLRSHHIDTVVDVRSAPYSRHVVCFNRECLEQSLKQAGIYYIFMGDSLGARPEDRSCYRGTVADYELIARSDGFVEGIKRVLTCAVEHRIVLMCSERDPLDCHRTILVARHLVKHGADIVHILHDGSVESGAAADLRLLRKTKQTTSDMFGDDSLEKAYNIRGGQIMYREDG